MLYLNDTKGHGLLWESTGETDSLPLYGSIRLACERFGLFSLLTSRGTRVRTSCEMNAFAGRTLPGACAPVLTLHGKVGGLALMPGSTIQGRVVLSHGRVYQGRTSREVKDKGLKVLVRESASLPFDSTQIIQAFESGKEAYAKACVPP